ncbi:MAG: calcium/sodium antiporter [Bacteroidota bacterium]
MLIGITFIGGLVALIAGAELFLKSVDRFGVAWKISPVVMGLTVVAFATGAPELAISLQAAVENKPDLVLGNIIGSNISNILLILGIAGLVKPLAITRRIIKIDVPMVLAASLLLFGLARDGSLSSSDGVLILIGLVGYSIFTYFQIKKDRAANKKEKEGTGESENEAKPGIRFYLINCSLLITGLALIVAGSSYMVDAAVEIALILGVSELIVGLTIVSIGTSLPEVATSLAAVRKGDSDTAVANVMGSNLYNILLTLGLTVVIAPGALSVAANAIELDMPFMILVAVVCLPLFWPGKKLGRFEAFGFLGFYAAYLTYLVFDALDSPFQHQMEELVIWIVAPITLTLIAGKFVLDYMRRKRTPS